MGFHECAQAAWVCSSFLEGFEWKEAPAPSYTSRPDWQIIPAPLLCQTWDAEGSLKVWKNWVKYCCAAVEVCYQCRALNWKVLFGSLLSVLCSVFTLLQNTTLYNRATWTLQPGSVWRCIQRSTTDVSRHSLPRVKTPYRPKKHNLIGRKESLHFVVYWIQEINNYFECLLWKYFWNYYLVTIVSPWAPYPWGPVILPTPEAPPQPPPKSR